MYTSLCKGLFGYSWDKSLRHRIRNHNYQHKIKTESYNEVITSKIYSLYVEVIYIIYVCLSFSTEKISKSMVNKLQKSIKTWIKYLKTLSATPSSHWISNLMTLSLYHDNLFWKENLIINSTEHLRCNKLWELKNPEKLRGGKEKVSL